MSKQKLAKGSRGAALVEYVLLYTLGIGFVIMTFGLSNLGRSTACTLCAAKFGFQTSAREETFWDSLGIESTAYAMVGPPAPSTPDEYLQLCRDGFIDVQICE